MSGPSQFLINTKKYEIYVRIIGGLADGPIIWIDASGHIHIKPDPRPLDDAKLKAVKQIEAGLAVLVH